VKKTVRKRMKEISVLMESKTHSLPPHLASGEMFSQEREELGI
jgi:ADP-glucose pyrophosphorylase